MLISTAPLTNGPLTPPVSTGPAQASGDGGQAFTQALDQAAARLRDAAGDSAAPNGGEGRDGRGAKGDAPNSPRPDAHEARPPPVNRSQAATRKATAAQDKPDIDGASAADTPLRAETRDDGITPPANDEADDLPPDLPVWVSSLALPRPDAAAMATKAAATDADPVARIADKDQAAADGAAAAARLLDPQAKTAVVDAPDTSTPPFATLLPAATPRHADVRDTRQPQPASTELAAKGKDAAAGADSPLQALGQSLQSLAAQRASAEPGPAPAVQPALSTASIQFAAAPPRPAQSAAAAQAEVTAPVGSADFAPGLSSQLSVMVRNGIDHAQLKLNPAEMGPIEVRIRLDGTQAQVDFSAAHAATRQALQDAVPTLAGALRENGLTLTGGGVFEQAREQRGEAGRDGSRQPLDGDRAPRDGAAPALPSARRPRARGVVDLYA